MALELYTAPDERVVNVSEMKAHLRLNSDETAFDAAIGAYIDAATRFIQEHTGAQLCTATYKLHLDSFYQAAWQHSLGGGQYAQGCGDQIWLQRPPLASVSSITYYDSDNSSQTLSSAYYVVDAKSMPGRVALASNYSWPSTYDRPNAITITYVAGFGAATAVPDTFKQAIKILAATWFKNAEAVSDTMQAKLPFALEALLQMESTGLVL